MTTALVLLALCAASCDAEFDVHDNVIVFDPCSLVSAAAPVCDDAPVPRLEGQPCDGAAVCVSGLVCLCSTCFDMEN